MSMNRLLKFALVAFSVLLFVVPVWAQSDPPTDNEVNQVAKKLYCPVCENVPLDVCPTQACIQWRATIREKMTIGWSDQQILDYFAEQYGQRVLAQPTTEGINLFIWLIPPLVVLAGAVALWRVLQTMRRPTVTAQAATEAATKTPTSTSDDYVARLEQELEKRR